MKEAAGLRRAGGLAGVFACGILLAARRHGGLQEMCS